MGYIYKIQNEVNSKLYVGMTTNEINVRWRKHKTMCKSSTMLLCEAMRKYGYDKFNIEILEEVSDNSKLEERERYWIKELNTLDPEGYNKTKGGISLFGEDNQFYGRTHNKNTIHKLRKLASKRIGEKNPFYGLSHSDESKKKISTGNRGKVHSEKYKEYMREINTGELNPFYGKCHSTETRELLSRIHQTKNIEMLDKAGKVLEHFEYIDEAVAYLKNTGKSKITTKDESIRTRVLNASKSTKEAYGFFWKIQR